MFHGCNVSGACKLPSAPFPGSLDPEDELFWDPSYSFIGRPFSLDSAKVHFQRLRNMGCSMIRFVLVWEAIEPKRGEYCEEYLEYLQQVLQIGSDLGLLFILDCHQDCWSRFCGGSGAPLWTIELAGLDARTFGECGAALLQKPELSSYADPGTLWATNYTKFGTNNMFTLFFGGEVFAPDLLVDGRNIGTILRESYIHCFGEVAKRVRHISGVLGFDPMNEPHHGFIGLPSLNHFNEDVLLHLGRIPSPLQSMKLAAGLCEKVPVYTTSWPKPTRCTRYEDVNQREIRAWKPGATDIWKAVWQDSSNTGSDHFFSKFPPNHSRAGDKVNFQDDFYVPFLQEFNDHISRIMPRAFLFPEPIPNSVETPLTVLSRYSNICYAPHWYDLKSLFEKRFSSRCTMDVQALSRGSRNILAHTYFGYSAAIRNYTKQLKTIFDEAPKHVPRLVGECGVPFDMNEHYRHSKLRGQASDYESQTEMLDILCRSLENNMLSYTLWNYTPENRAYRGGGDFWNGEDFSLFCEPELEFDQTCDAKYAGIRSPRAFIRPYATKIAGLPIKSHFDLPSKTYTLIFRPSDHADQMHRQTEIFIPQIHNHVGQDLNFSAAGRTGTWRVDDAQETLIFIHDDHSADKNLCHITIQFGTRTVMVSEVIASWKSLRYIGIIILCLAISCGLMPKLFHARE